ncbi:MAG: hypothetical protein AB9903_19065 [Vulcanimicrobiota bacterium]
MGGMEIGLGFSQASTPDLKKPALQKEAKQESSASQTSAAGGDMSYVSGSAVRTGRNPLSIIESPELLSAEEPPSDERGMHIGVVNGSSVHMRVNGKGEAEFNSGGPVWTKSPPAALSKSKIIMSLETIHTMGIDTRPYLRSLNSLQNYSAPLSLVADDDINHSYSIIEKLHEEQVSQLASKRKKSQLPAGSVPIFLTNPDYEGHEQKFLI